MTTNTLKMPVYHKRYLESTKDLNPEIQKDLQKVQDSLSDIKRLTSLYHLLQRPRSLSIRNNDSITNIKNLSIKEVGHALISQIEVDRLFPLINNLTINGTGSTAGIIALINNDNELLLKTSEGIANHSTGNTSLKINDSILKWAIKHGTTLVVNDINKDPRFKQSQSNWILGKTILCVPIKTKGKVAGIISVSNKKAGNVYGTDDARFLETIAAYTSIAIGNSHLSESVKGGNTLEQLTLNYYNENNKYLPATLRSIKAGAFAGCDLYLQTIVNNEVKHLLYCKGFKLLEDERKESFVRKNINRIYVAKNGTEQYLRYMETNMGQFVHDGTVELQERAHILYDIASNIINDAHKNTNINIIAERAREWTTTMLDFVVINQESHSHFIRTLKYNGKVFNHSVNMAILGILFGYYLGYSKKDLAILGAGILLHDIGFTCLNTNTIIEENVENLSKQEKETFKKHAELGYFLLSKNNIVPKEACLIAKQHHEQFNGKGYPEGMFGEEIHLYSRITHILDEYELQMSRDSLYEQNSAFKVLQYMVGKMDGSFDNDILKKFISFLNASVNGISL
ncbi:MAG: GAF domain-containing protein [Candidatus Kuenenia sp.]|nr:GAF domain-containing protein [Candidatus Kuenenia hertensis]